MKLQLKEFLVLCTLESIAISYGQGIVNDISGPETDEIYPDSSNGTYLCEGKERCTDKAICKDEGYQSKHPPADDVTKISLEFDNIKVLEINPKENKIKVSFRQRLSWLEHRITVDVSYLDQQHWHDGSAEKTCPIWYPNITPKGKIIQKNRIKVPFNYMIFKVGEVIQMAGKDRNSTRIVMGQKYTLQFLCDHDVDNFPFDTYECKLGETNEETRPLQLLLGDSGRENVTRTAYSFSGFEITVTWHGGIIAGKSSRVKVNLKLIRNISPYIFRYYLPCMAVVCVSQISFIIPPSSIPGRIGLLATLFLTLTNLFINLMVNDNYLQFFLVV